MKFNSFCSAALIAFALLGCAEVGDDIRDVVRPDVQDADLADPVQDLGDLPEASDPLPDGPIDVPVDAGDLDAADTGDPAVDPEPDEADSTDTASDDAAVDDTAADPGPGTCTPSDFPVQAQCNPTYKCTLGATTGCTATGLCDVPGPQGENQICTVSSDSDNCQAGYICLGDGVEERCRKFCSSDTQCTPLGTNAGCLIGISTTSCPDGLTGLTVCTHGCDYFYQTGCASNQACRVLIPPATFVVYSDCTAAGTGTQDASCPNGSTDCAAGYDCFNVDDGTTVQPLCLKLCNYSGGYPTCDDPYNYTCSRNTDWPLPIGVCMSVY